MLPWVFCLTETWASWYRQAFYPMPLANHHELLNDYFRLFHKHNPEHAMNIIIYITLIYTLSL